MRLFESKHYSFPLKPPTQFGGVSFSYVHARDERGGYVLVVLSWVEKCVNIQELNVRLLFAFGRMLGA